MKNFSAVPCESFNPEPLVGEIIFAIDEDNAHMLRRV